MQDRHIGDVRVRYLPIAAAWLLLAACEQESPPLPPPHVHYPTYSMVFFDSGSAALSKRSEETLASILSEPQAPWLRATLAPGSKSKICLLGTSDSTGDEVSNRQLRRRRAEAVGRYLVELGVRPDQMLVGDGRQNKAVVNRPPNTAEGQNRAVFIYYSSKHQCPEGGE